MIRKWALNLSSKAHHNQSLSPLRDAELHCIYAIQSEAIIKRFGKISAKPIQPTISLQSKNVLKEDHLRAKGSDKSNYIKNKIVALLVNCSSGQRGKSLTWRAGFQ